MTNNATTENTKRLAGALDRADKRTIQILAHYLSYEPEQLLKDIKSLQQYIRQVGNINQ